MYVSIHIQCDPLTNLLSARFSDHLIENLNLYVRLRLPRGKTLYSLIRLFVCLITCDRVLCLLYTIEVH